mmetsp:Transcript_38009/g.56527  ORF Transcript_38009/g.56527 Transcript_38009/m.56527 type:complete len:210 (-) Transcript_38009:617-1246(-)
MKQCCQELSSRCRESPAILLLRRRHFLWYLQIQIVVISKSSQDAPRHVQSILTYKDIKNGQKSRHRKLAILDDFLCRGGIVLIDNLFPSRQITFNQRYMKGLILKGIKFDIAQETIVILVVYAEDASKCFLTFRCNLSSDQVVKRREGIQNALLCFEKHFVDSDQIFGTAFDALTDKAEALHKRNNLLSTPSQSLFVHQDACASSWVMR